MKKIIFQINCSVHDHNHDLCLTNSVFHSIQLENISFMILIYCLIKFRCLYFIILNLKYMLCFTLWKQAYIIDPVVQFKNLMSANNFSENVFFFSSKLNLKCEPKNLNL